MPTPPCSPDDHAAAARQPLVERFDIARLFILLLFIGLMIGASLWIIQPFVPALLWATMIVVATWPVMIRVQGWLGRRRWAATLFMTLGLTALIVVPIGLAVGTIAEHAPGIRDHARHWLSGPLPPPPEWLQNVPVVGARLVREWQNFVNAGPGVMLAKIQPYTGKLATWVAARAGGLGMLTLHLLLTIALSAVLYLHGETAANGLKRFAARLGGERGAQAVVLAGQAIRAVAMGIVVTALVQTALGAVGLLIAGVPYVLILASIMFVCCIAQIGPGLVLFAAVGWLAYEGRTGMAVFLGVWTLVVVSLDNVLRPLLIKRGADIPLLLILTGVMGGLIAFGVVGLFVGPAVLAVSYTLLNDWIDRPLDGRSAAPAPCTQKAAAGDTP